MQRRAHAYASGTAAVLLSSLGLAVLTGCSGSTGTEGAASDAKPGGGVAAAAAPGKYRTLREACGTVGQSTLKDLLPGAAELPTEQQRKAYAGTAAVTYDTDRRVGCRWQADSPSASHRLVVDFERVVSYDAAVSDEDRAQEVYAGKQAAAQLPVAENPRDDKGSLPPGKPSASTGATGATGATGTTTGASSGAPAAGKAQPTDDADPDASDGLEPRVLDGLGDAAFLDDQLTRAGSTAQSRTVSVVFRTSNVIVTVRYAEQPALVTEVPDSKELQEKARGLARKLGEQIGA